MLRALVFIALLMVATAASAKEHPGRGVIERNGYQGPSTCEKCHRGKAREFLQTVHWKHASKVDNVKGLDPKQEYGMKNRVYVMCNGNDLVNNLKEITSSTVGKSKFSGCNSCHPGDHLNDVGSTGLEAEAAVDCLVCHSRDYDFRQRKPGKDANGRVIMGQDRSLGAALAIGKPTAKNCMACHEAAGGGVLVKRGFSFNKDTDAHAAKDMSCVDCHQTKNHRIPTGLDPNNWANDGVRVTCETCHEAKPHRDQDLNRHCARVACQTCHIPRTGGAFAKDFTRWEQTSDKFYEPATLRKEANETVPVYAWYNGTVINKPNLIGPDGTRGDIKSRIYPFKIFQGKAYYNRQTGELLSMDFAQPMATGDTRAGVESAARTLGFADPASVAREAVPGWQTVYFGSNHLVTRKNALTCSACHALNGVLNWGALGYLPEEVQRLTSPELYFGKLLERQKEDW